MNKLIRIVFSFVLCMSTAFAQHSEIKVWNEDQKPIEGATVNIGNTELMTGKAGSVLLPDTLQLPAQIVIRYVGYRTQTLTMSEYPKQTTNVTMLLLPMTIDTVLVNTGYAQFQKHTNVGSFEVIRGEDILKENVPFNIIDALEDRVSSVTVDRRTNSGSLMVRGLSTIRGDRTPLIVLDNFPYEGGLENINPNDIENITILKDASAASIWGARASNGVIVITTKRGARGQKLRVELSSNQQLIQKPNIFYQKIISNKDMIDVERFLFENNYYTARENQRSKPSLSPVIELLIRQRDNGLSADELDNALQHLENNDLRRDFYDHVYRLGVNSQYALRIAKNDKPIQWSFSTGYDHNVDYLHTQTKRATAMLALNTSLTDKINIDLNIGFTHLSDIGGKDDMVSLNDASGRAANYYRLRGDGGEVLPVIKDYRQYYKDNISNPSILDWNYYPMEEHRWRELTDRLNSMRMQVGATYEILPNLELRGMFRYDIENGRQDNMYHQESYYVRNLVNRYTLPKPDGTIARVIPEGAIRNMADNDLATYNYRGAIHYEKSWNVHKLSFQSGMDVSSRKTNNASYVLYGFNPHNYTNVPIDFFNSYPSFIDGSLQSVQNNVSLGKQVRNTVSQYSYLRYGYDERYELFGTVRRDASNLFGVSTNNKWNPFWSIGAGWTVSAENFYNWNDLLPWVRLRLTNGIAGNVSERMAAVTTISYNSASNLTGVPYANFSNYYNPDLTWEESRTLNLGLDFRSAGNLLEGSVEYYRKRASRLYGNTPIDYTAGVGYTVMKNVADMEASGLDASLKIHLPITKSMVWSMSVFANYYKDKVLDYYQTSDRGSSYVSGIGITAVEGHPVHALYSYDYRGLNSEGDPVGMFEGEESVDYRRLVGTTVKVSDLVYAGPVFPKWSGAFEQIFRYKKWALNMRVSYRFGHVFRRETINYGNLFGSRLGHADFMDRWQKAGDERATSVPKMSFPVNNNRDAFFVNSTYTVTKGDYIRLNNIGVSYNETILRNKKMEIGLQVNNVGLLYKANKVNLDPEYPNMPLSPIYQFRLSFQL